MKTILSQLSTQKGERSGESNKMVAQECIKSPELLNEINTGLLEKDRKLVADCAEVMTLVSEKSPELVAPFFENLATLIKHKDNRVRWEATHTLAQITTNVPDYIQHIIPEIESIIETDKSVIVRDYCSLIFANYASINRERALEIFPKLKLTLQQWGERHAKQAFMGLMHVCSLAPELNNEINKIAEEYINTKKKTVQSIARKLLKKTE